MRYPTASGARINDKTFNLYAANMKIKKDMKAGMIRSLDLSIPAGMCREEARGFLASMCLSMTLFATIPTVRAPTIAIVIQMNFEKVGSPFAASNIPTYANGRAKTLS